MKLNRLCTSLLICVLLNGCAQKENYYGYSFPPEYIKSLHVHKTNVSDVRQLLGSPTTESNFGDKTYYYIAQQQSRVAFLLPKVEDHQVLALTFDNNGVLSTVKTYTLEEARSIKFDEGNTRLRGSESGALEQIVGNIGKFNPQSNPKPQSGE